MATGIEPRHARGCAKSHDKRTGKKIRSYFDVFPFYRRGTFRRQRSYLRSERLR